MADDDRKGRIREQANKYAKGTGGFNEVIPGANDDAADLAYAKDIGRATREESAKSRLKAAEETAAPAKKNGAGGGAKTDKGTAAPKKAAPTRRTASRNKRQAAAKRKLADLQRADKLSKEKTEFNPTVKEKEREKAPVSTEATPASRLDEIKKTASKPSGLETTSTPVKAKVKRKSFLRRVAGGFGRAARGVGRAVTGKGGSTKRMKLPEKRIKI